MPVLGHAENTQDIKASMALCMHAENTQDINEIVAMCMQRTLRTSMELWSAWALGQAGAALEAPQRSAAGYPLLLTQRQPTPRSWSS